MHHYYYDTVYRLSSCLFFFHDPAPPEIYTLSLHDALPICAHRPEDGGARRPRGPQAHQGGHHDHFGERSEEHTSELQSQSNLVCRLLLEKKKITLLVSWWYSTLVHTINSRTFSRLSHRLLY